MRTHAMRRHARQCAQKSLRVQVWTSKTSDVVRCLLKREAVPSLHWLRGRMQPSGPTHMPCASPEEAATFEVRPPTQLSHKCLHVCLYGIATSAQYSAVLYQNVPGATCCSTFKSCSRAHACACATTESLHVHELASD
jgi:hypothetical protein